MAQTLRDWYRYLEQQMHVSLPEEPFAGPPGTGGRPDPVHPPDERDTSSRTEASGAGRPEDPPDAPVNPMAHADALRRRISAVVQQSTLPIELGPEARRRGGRRPITETREQIIRRLLDPELSLHEAAAVLNLSKATVRRYTDQGKLVCLRTAGGQRRFRLSALLTFLDRQAAERSGG